MRVARTLALALLALGLAACGERGASSTVRPPPEPDVSPKPAPPTPRPAETRLATFGGGCFWCTEAVFSRLVGVESVASGFSGGTGANPSYEDVCTGTTGHAEVIQVRFDPTQVRYEALLEVFFATHDPTTLNRQGHDLGTQYRSIILWHDEEQRAVAEATKKKLDASGELLGKVVTEIVPYKAFWPAGEYHAAYFARNPTQGYCHAVIAPKVKKFEAKFKDRLK